MIIKKLTILTNNFPNIIGENHLNILFDKKLDKNFFNLNKKRISVNYIIKGKSFRLFSMVIKDIIYQEMLINIIILSIKLTGFNNKVDFLLLFYGDFPKNTNK
jgi:hypothetical protein